jgi:hypothetical protein
MLTPREALALVIAVAADAVQWLVLPLFAEGGLSPADAALDAAAFAVLTGLLGFSPLLLPTVVVELLPVADLAPAWSVAVVAIIWRRRRAHRQAAADLVDAHPGSGREVSVQVSDGP